MRSRGGEEKPVPIGFSVTQAGIAVNGGGDGGGDLTSNWTVVDSHGGSSEMSHARRLELKAKRRETRSASETLGGTLRSNHDRRASNIINPKRVVEYYSVLSSMPHCVLRAPNQLCVVGSRDARSGALTLDASFAYQPSNWKSEAEMWHFEWLPAHVARELKRARGFPVCFVRSKIGRYWSVDEAGAVSLWPEDVGWQRIAPTHTDLLRSLKQRQGDRRARKMSGPSFANADVPTRSSSSSSSSSPSLSAAGSESPSSADSLSLDLVAGYARLVANPDALIASPIRLYRMRQGSAASMLSEINSIDMLTIGQDYETHDGVPLCRLATSTVRVGKTMVMVRAPSAKLGRRGFGVSSSSASKLPGSSMFPGALARSVSLVSVPKRGGAHDGDGGNGGGGGGGGDDDDLGNALDDGAPTKSTLRAVGERELFAVELYGECVALRNLATDRYVGLPRDWQLNVGKQHKTKWTGRKYMTTDEAPGSRRLWCQLAAPSPSSNCFELHVKMALLAFNQRYVCAHPMNSRLVVNRKEALTWEQSLIELRPDRASTHVLTSIKRYWTCNMSNGKLSASDKQQTLRTLFEFEWKSRSRVAIKAPNGRYVRCVGADLVADRPTVSDPSCVFVAVFFGGAPTDASDLDELAASFEWSRESNAEALSSIDVVPSPMIRRSERLSGEQDERAPAPAPARKNESSDDDDERADQLSDESEWRSRYSLRRSIKMGIDDITRALASTQRLSFSAGSSSSSQSSVSPRRRANSTSNEDANVGVFALQSSGGSSWWEPVAPAEKLMATFEGLAHLKLEGMTIGDLHLTSYRLLFCAAASTSAQDPRRSTLPRSGGSASWSVPLACIERTTRSDSLGVEGFFGLELDLYNLRSIRLCATPRTLQTTSADELYRLINEAMMTGDEGACSALVFGRQLDVAPEHDGWRVYDALQDYERLGVGAPASLGGSGGGEAAAAAAASRFRVSRINENYALCKTYPQLLVVPAAITDDDLREIAQFRSKKRVPAIVWTNPMKGGAALARCSQPRTGLRNARCEADEHFFEMLRVGSQDHRIVWVLDARPALNAMANRLRGAGSENLTDGYPSCQRKYLGIGNIHKIRASFEKLRDYCHRADEQQSDQSPAELAATGWIGHVRAVLSGAKFAASLVNDGNSVLVHCSDGWDRTPQLVALAELMLDPFYRTLRGFEQLVEKEWCSFGHMFASRTAVLHKRFKDSNRSPIFVQFVDCVFQLTRLFPTAFEFNALFLKTILHHVFSTRYGTFLFDSDRYRALYDVRRRTDSVWTATNRLHAANPSLFANAAFNPISSHRLALIDLDVEPNSHALTLWRDLYLDSSHPFFA
jgi:Myotubularin-like phosphatase domain/Fascin domain